MARAGPSCTGPRRSSLSVSACPPCPTSPRSCPCWTMPARPGLRYYKLNKPAGVTTTLRDEHARRTLDEMLPRGPRVFPVGRLDRDSEGLLLLTNDGDLAHRLQHPRFGVDKEYLVEVQG